MLCIQGNKPKYVIVQARSPFSHWLAAQLQTLHGFDLSQLNLKSSLQSYLPLEPPPNQATPPLSNQPNQP